MNDETRHGRTFRRVAADAGVTPTWLSTYLKREIENRAGVPWWDYIANLPALLQTPETVMAA